MLAERISLPAVCGLAGSDTVVEMWWHHCSVTARRIAQTTSSNRRVLPDCALDCWRVMELSIIQAGRLLLRRRPSEAYDRTESPRPRRLTDVSCLIVHLIVGE